MIIINAPHFCASVIIDGVTLRVNKAAPVLRYMMGWDRVRVLAYADRRGWRCEMRD
jgi:hypothetical protein